MSDADPRHEYLGDGVYASFDGYHVWLRTGSHDNEQGQIALDPDVFQTLVHYRQRVVGGEKEHTQARAAERVGFPHLADALRGRVEKP